MNRESILNEIRRGLMNVPDVMDVTEWTQDEPCHGRERHVLHFSHAADIRPPQMSMTLIIGEVIEATVYASIGHVGKVGSFVKQLFMGAYMYPDMTPIALGRLVNFALQERQTKRRAMTIHKYTREARAYMRRLGQNRRVGP